MIKVFKRKAWTKNGDYPGGWEPFIGRKTHVCYVDNADEARKICAEHNNSRKSRGDSFCEFEAE